MTDHARLGYITGTFDTPHEGHMAMLQSCAALCDKLVVGLVTDELAVRQKRKPLMPYAARFAVLSSCKYVCSVVGHEGEPKSEAHRRLGFDACFTDAEEHLDTPEFAELRSACPEVRIIAIPRSGLGKSSSSIAQDFALHALLDAGTSGVLAPSTCGAHILRFGGVVVKPLHLCAEDVASESADNMGFFAPGEVHAAQPRRRSNFGAAAEEDFPFLSGVNPQRERLVSERYRSKPWCLFLGARTSVFAAQEEKRPKVEEIKEHATLVDFARHVAEKRASVARVDWLLLRHGGGTLADFAARADCTPARLAGVCGQVLCALVRLREDGVLHGDVHLRNVLVRTEVGADIASLVDWGWCSARNFELCEREREWLEAQLAANADQQDFLLALMADANCRRLLAGESA